MVQSDFRHIYILIHVLVFFVARGDCNWSLWWTYDGISGPGFWGTMNKLEWSICHRGKNQSPVNIVPEDLLFDPGLKHIQISGNKGSSPGILDYLSYAKPIKLKRAVSYG
ncbi:putative carbonic anhydrase-like protein 1 [Pecten maximus]|uniref:putative carbonic anhydrase-like protein 1 n=1 Tax=Pecten maximus TaxID=6579 RepID=UPI001458AE5E|nr:putative carbonic anhydrase-like protein 1 [Pecten maximus]